MRLRFSRLAEADIIAIGDFIARDNPARARSFVADLRRRCRHLTAFPDAAPLRPELGEGVRAAVFGRYLILYVVQPGSLLVHRVVHGARITTPRGRG